MAIPKYQYIKDELKSKIISGQFENGDKFYTEAELITMYDVSSITVVRALNELAKDGYIIRQQGKGTFVSRARKHKLVEFSDVEIFPTQNDQVTVLSIERGNDLKFLDKLDLKGHQFYYKIERLRKAKDIPYIYHQSYIPEQYINEIIFPTPEAVATLLDIDTNFPTVFQVKTTQLESTGQILEYSEAYKRGDFFKIKFVSRSGNH